MKKTLAILLFTLGLNNIAFAKTQGDVYSPKQGIICDKKAQFCVDNKGISMKETKSYLGEKAKKSFLKMIDGIDDMDMTVFTFSNGLSCDTNKKICKKSKWDDNANPKWTKILFGEEGIILAEPV